MFDVFFPFLEEGGSLRIVLHFSEAIVNHSSPIVPELGGIWRYNPSNVFVVYGIALLAVVIYRMLQGQRLEGYRLS